MLHFWKHGLLWTALTCVFVLTTPMIAAATDGAPDIAQMTLADFEIYLDTRIPQILKDTGVEGAAVGIMRDGQLVFTAGYGLRERKLKLPVETDTVFQMASISKTFAAWGVMKLVAEGKVDLDAPVETYLTRWKLPPSEFDHTGVTVRRLLSHTAGISLGGYPGLNPKKSLPTLEESLNGKTGGVGKVFVKYEPAFNFVYSGGGYTILQLMIEEVSGKSFAEYMTAEVLQPLGMNLSTFDPAAVAKEKLAKGYDAWSHALPNYLFTAKAAAGLYSTAEDMGKWLVAALETYEGTSERVLDSDTFKMMLKPVKAGYGLGHMIDQTPEKDKLIWHSGANAGWRTVFILLPDRRDGIVVLTNSDQGAGAMFSILNEWFTWENSKMRFNYQENAAMKMLYFYDILRNVVQ